ncbi:MAG: DUF1501 domain-containing protein, partial [Planctomycetota bacterium]|nr:DUF1501 domain-containing protein [Planctomycetota bacterium]
MNHHWTDPLGRTKTRRQMLKESSAGFGGLALSWMLGREALAEEASSASPLAVREGHHTPRAKRVIFLFMHGGPSQVDTFDHKPLLDRDDGKKLPFPKPRIVSGATGNLLRSPWKFRPRGESGIPVSELFPEVGSRVDDLCV